MSPLTRPNRLLLIGAFCLGGYIRLGPNFQTPREPWIEHWSSQAIEQATETRS